jgi:hypothetical protein
MAALGGDISTFTRDVKTIEFIGESCTRQLPIDAGGNQPRRSWESERKLKFLQRRLAVLAGGILCLTASGCHSYWVDANVENQTGEVIHELEVDYPTASFGENTLESGHTMHYRFQIRGSGPVKVEYTFDNGKVIHAQGLNLTERQQGQLQIRLMPQGKAEFLPKLESVR